MFANVKFFVSFLCFCLVCGFNCGQKKGQETSEVVQDEKTELPPPSPVPQKMQVGAEQTDLYFPILKGKNIAAVVNQTSGIGEIHLIDSLLNAGISIKKIFAPEHGFRGEAPDGEHVKDGVDIKTQLPIISLYGSKKKPSKADLKNIDLIIFDIQDVGARFYTYISSMSYLMEACAENNISLMILDRPNPNGQYVDGPILKKGYESMVGLHPVPVVHGMTVGEYAQMVNGENWLPNNLKCNLEIIKCANYDHTSYYNLPIKPSPNLPNMRAIYLYPSLCFFEGTQVSVGRGTDKQFQIIGAPGFTNGEYEFTPAPNTGSKYPPQENKLCKGYDLTNIDFEKIKNRNSLDLSHLINFYNNYEPKNDFFLKTLFFDKLAGSDNLRKQLIAGNKEEEIRATWAEGLIKYKAIRKKYLLYKDFE